MTDHTFAVEGMPGGCLRSARALADAAFNIPGVRAVGIDRAGGRVTVTTTRPVGVAEFAAAIDTAGFALSHRQPMPRRAS